MDSVDPPPFPFSPLQASRPRKGMRPEISKADILKSAAIIGDVAKINLLLADGFPVNSADNEGNSPLHHGVEHGSMDVIHTIVERNGDVNAVNISLTSPLHVAVISGKQDIVSYLLAQNAAINHHDISGNTALHWAVTANKKNIVKLLLKSGAVPDTIDNNQITPLLLAVGINSESIMHLLLKKKADINQKQYQGNTAVHLACSNNKTSIVSFLLNREADPNIQNINGDTPLHIATRKENSALVELLLAHNANPTSKNIKGEIPSVLTRDETIRKMLQIRKIKVLDDDWCIVELDKKKSLTLMEARDDEEKRNIIERLGQKKAKDTYIIVLDSGKASVEAGLKGFNINGIAKVTNDDICCPVSVNSQSRESLIRKFGGFLTSKLHSADSIDALHSSTVPDLRRSAPDFPTEQGETRDLYCSLPIKESPYSNIQQPKPTYTSLRESSPCTPVKKSKHTKSASVSDTFQSSPYSDLGQIFPESTDEKLVKLLENLGLAKYTAQFLEEEWDWETLLEITNEDLEIMGIKAGSRRKLMNAISRARAEEGLGSIHTTSALLHSGSTPNSISYKKCSYIVPFSDISMRMYVGKGFYGEVFLGSWNGIDVAVKKMNQSQVGSLDKWLLEIELLFKLRHPNIVTFYCACTEHPNYCIVLEFASRGSLESVLADDMVDMSHERRLRFLCDIARGIKYLHSQDPPIIHRDLKSDNILIDENWVAKVSDFGLSRYKDDTYSYGSPSTPFDVTINPIEVLKDNHISEKADAYSFGLMMWELYTRVRSFKNMNPRWVAEQIMNHGVRPSLEDTCSWDPVYVTLMQECWAEDHKERPMFPEILSRLEVMLDASKNTLPHASSGYILTNDM